MNLGLKDKVVLISGGAKGIGEACARAFLEEDALVCIVDYDDSAGKAMEASAPPGRLYFHHADLTDENRCRETVESVIQKFGRLDSLINNAGFNDSIGLEGSPSEFMGSVQRNLGHVYALTHFASEHLKQSKGSIVNLGSKVSLTGQGGTSGYAAAKGAINALTREWAIGLASDEVRVNAVLPAECDTHQYRAWFDSLEDPEATRRSVEALVPLGNRMTTPEEMANMIVFLASSASSHTTGQIICVDGGYTHLDRAISHKHSKWS
jgi:L-fucose dehydrogenase